MAKRIWRMHFLTLCHHDVIIYFTFSQAIWLSFFSHPSAQDGVCRTSQIDGFNLSVAVAACPFRRPLEELAFVVH